MSPLKFSVPKLGSTAEENEDAADFDERRGLVAVADGATDAAYSRMWARLLVRHFLRVPELTSEGVDFCDWLRRPRRAWKRSVDRRGPLPWYAEQKVADGSFAAFLGVRIESTTDGVRWQAITLGDCCLFVVEDEELRVSFPATNPSAFGSTPFLVGTLASGDAASSEHWRRDGGLVRSGALFLAMSDGLAPWFLRAAQNGEKPWVCLRRIEEDQAFTDLVSGLREEGKIRNDDSTLVVWGT